MLSEADREEMAAYAPEFSVVRTQRAIKEHTCSCGKPILPGELYTRIVGKSKEEGFFCVKEGHHLHTWDKPSLLLPVDNEE